MLDALVDFELRVSFEVFPHGTFVVVAGTPGRSGNMSLGMSFIRLVYPHHKIAADCA